MSEEKPHWKNVKRILILFFFSCAPRLNIYVIYFCWRGKFTGINEICVCMVFDVVYHSHKLLLTCSLTTLLVSNIGNICNIKQWKFSQKEMTKEFIISLHSNWIDRISRFVIVKMRKLLKQKLFLFVAMIEFLRKSHQNSSLSFKHMRRFSELEKYLYFVFILNLICCGIFTYKWLLVPYSIVKQCFWTFVLVNFYHSGVVVIYRKMLSTWTLFTIPMVHFEFCKCKVERYFLFPLFYRRFPGKFMSIPKVICEMEFYFLNSSSRPVGVVCGV